jgi:hypothetical protein
MNLSPIQVLETVRGKMPGATVTMTKMTTRGSGDACRFVLEQTVESSEMTIDLYYSPISMPGQWVQHSRDSREPVEISDPVSEIVKALGGNPARPSREAYIAAVVALNHQHGYVLGVRTDDGWPDHSGLDELAKRIETAWNDDATRRAIRAPI